MTKGVIDGTGISLDSNDLKKVEDSLEDLKRKHRRNLCRYCLQDIEFKESDSGKGNIPHDPDGTPHWKTCLAGQYRHKKAALKISQKFGIYFLLKMGIDLQKEVNLTEDESKITQFMVQRLLKTNKLEVKSDVGAVIPKIPEEEELDSGMKAIAQDSDNPPEVGVEDMVKTGDDPIGDPDEDLAAPEELIEKEK